MAVLMPEPQGTALGLTTVYADQYDPKLLFPISRNIGRDAIGDHDFIGTDIWRMYEFSWLNANGLPQAAEVDLFVPASSPSIIESKSLKLYQGSFAQTRFAGGAEQVAAILKRDLSNAAGAPVEVAVNTLDTWTPTIDDLPGELLEEAFPDVSITDFEVNPELLEKAPAAIDTDVKGNIRAAVWRTNLFSFALPRHRTARLRIRLYSAHRRSCRPAFPPEVPCELPRPPRVSRTVRRADLPRSALEVHVHRA